eukprot:6900247-Prymnesium_polylepis.1
MLCASAVAAVPARTNREGCGANCDLSREICGNPIVGVGVVARASSSRTLVPLSVPVNHSTLEGRLTYAVAFRSTHGH